ncbi:MAG: hypothetical protein K0R50_4796 [Eubacterium sp.]|nr:hypothetical protein [Eubacterium sp.]
MYDLTVEPKTDFYKRSAAVPASSSVFFTITSAPAVYEVQIQGLTRDILAYAVALKRTESSLSSQTPVEARILCMYP